VSLDISASSNALWDKELRVAAWRKLNIPGFL
jgi:hypothetical protein